jgi:hypothetical protein
MGQLMAVQGLLVKAADYRHKDTTLFDATRSRHISESGVIMSDIDSQLGPAGNFER